MEESTENKTRFLLDAGHNLYNLTIPIHKKADQLQKDLESFVELFDDFVNGLRAEIYKLHDIPYEEMVKGNKLDKAEDILSDYFFDPKSKTDVFMKRFLKEIGKINKPSK